MTNETTKRNDECEIQQNLVGFFELLLKIDQRFNPKEYGLATIDKDGQEVYTKNIDLNQ